VDEGERCPCCEQFAKVYRRKITSHTAMVLIAMWRKGGTDWVSLPALGMGHADEAKARYWGLIEAKPDEVRDDGSSRTGWWRLTDRGRRFVLNLTSIPKYVRIYDGRALSMDDSQQINIADALGTKFNYFDLMGGV